MKLSLILSAIFTAASAIIVLFFGTNAKNAIFSIYAIFIITCIPIIILAKIKPTNGIFAHFLLTKKQEDGLIRFLLIVLLVAFSSIFFAHRKIADFGGILSYILFLLISIQATREFFLLYLNRKR